MIRRKFKRVKIKLPVYIMVRGDVLQKMIQLESFDVSGGGMSFQSAHKIPLQSNSRVVVSRLGNLPGTAHIEGRVVYRWKNPTTGGYTVGVEFQKFVGLGQTELVQRIDDWHAGRGLSS